VTPDRAPAPTEGLQALRRTLQEAIQSLQRAIELLGDMAPDTVRR
jgi:hypothetical protein